MIISKIKLEGQSNSIRSRYELTQWNRLDFQTLIINIISNQILKFERLKKIAIISLLFIYLSSSTQLHEVFRLPILVQHFIVHNHANGDLTFWQFLDMHYAHGDVHDADYEEDMKLPFKSHHECDNFVTVFSLLPNHPQIKQPEYFQQTVFVEYNHSIKSSSVLESIWQPPKFC